MFTTEILPLDPPLQSPIYFSQPQENSPRPFHPFFSGAKTEKKKFNLNISGIFSLQLLFAYFMLFISSFNFYKEINTGDLKTYTNLVSVIGLLAISLVVSWKKELNVKVYEILIVLYTFFGSYLIQSISLIYSDKSKTAFYFTLFFLSAIALDLIAKSIYNFLIFPLKIISFYNYNIEIFISFFAVLLMFLTEMLIDYTNMFFWVVSLLPPLIYTSTLNYLKIEEDVERKYKAIAFLMKSYCNIISYTVLGCVMFLCNNRN